MKHPRVILCRFLALAWALCAAWPAVSVAQEKIPALDAVPHSLSDSDYMRFLQRRRALEEEYAAFSAAARSFNAKPASQQGDAEYAALQNRRAGVIELRKAFNAALRAQAEAAATPPVLRSFTLRDVKVKGEFHLVTGDGRRLSGAELEGAVIDTRTRAVTGPDSRAQFRLPDGTTFTIGQNADLQIDDFVFDPTGGKGRIAANLAKGFFRWVTGKVARRDAASMRVRTSATCICIRGTDFTLKQEADGSYEVRLLSGEVELMDLAAGKVVVLKPGQMITGGKDGIGKPVHLTGGIPSEVADAP